MKGVVSHVVWARVCVVLLFSVFVGRLGAALFGTLLLRTFPEADILVRNTGHRATVADKFGRD